jgi:predicted nucleic acid-binding protein
VTEVYADASALAKLIVDEAESEALEAELELRPVQLVSSALVRVELTRVVRIRSEGDPTRPVRELLETLVLVPVDDRVLARAARIADQRLRSLDAVHLASALTVGVETMLVYDRDLAAAAEAAGLEVLAPGA